MGVVPDLDLEKIRKYCESRVPKRLQNELRVEFGVRGKSVTIFDCRPPWHPNLPGWSRQPIAQLRYQETTKLWTLYWADRNSRWHLYDMIDPGRVDELLHEIEDDPTCIFWG